MGARKGVDCRQRIRNPRKIRESRRIDIKKFCAGGLAGETNVRERDRIAVAIAPGGRACQVRFESGQRSGVPMLAPFRARRLVELKFMFQIFAHPRHDQPRGSRGNNGGLGWVSSRYSMIASDSNKAGP